MGSHARLSPSSAERWMACPGSVAMEDGLPDSPNDNSDSGTATHFLAEQCLTTDTHPATYIGRAILVGTAPDFDGAIWGADTEPSPFDIRYTTTVDDERVVRANAYVQAVKKHAVGAVFASYEHQVSIAQLTGEAGASGTTDAAIVTADGELQVHDLKDGHGPVSAAENKQLRIYALGLYDELSAFCDINRVRVFIHQPRISHTADEWAVSLEDLERFRTEVKERAFHALQVLNNEPPATRHFHLRPGEKQCQWCKVKGPACPAHTKYVQEVIGAEFEDITALATATEEAKSGSKDVTPEALDLVELWVKAARGSIERRLFAGEAVPFWKLVQGKKGARAWRNEAEAEATLKTMRLKVEEMYDMKVISPTSVEKIFGEKGSAPSVKRWNKLQALITQKDGSPSVAPESDKRPALVIDASADFEDTTGEDLS